MSLIGNLRIAMPPQPRPRPPAVPPVMTEHSANPALRLTHPLAAPVSDRPSFGDPNGYNIPRGLSGPNPAMRPAPNPLPRNVPGPSNPVSDRPTSTDPNGYPGPGPWGNNTDTLAIHYGGYTPNYADLIKNDSGWQTFLDSYNNAEKANLLGRQTGVRQAAIGYGTIPDFSNPAYGLDQNSLGYLNADVDQATRDAASANENSGMSTHAQLMRQHQQNLDQMSRVLAGRGMLSSGEYGYQTNNENYRNATAVDQALRSMLGTVGSDYSNYASSEEKDAGDYQNALNQATTRQEQLPGGMPIAAYNGPAVWNASAGAYQDPYGQYYDASGTPLNAPH